MTSPAPAAAGAGSRASAPPRRAPARKTLPAGAVRVATTANELLEELHRGPLDEAGRRRLGHAYRSALRELARVLPATLAIELAELTPSLPEVPTADELRIAEAQLIGWLDGLFEGTRLAAMLARRVARQAEQRTGDERQAQGGGGYV